MQYVGDSYGPLDSERITFMEEIRKENIDEISINNRVHITHVHIGTGGYCAKLSGNDIAFFKKFDEAGNKIVELAESLDKKEAEIKSNQKEDAGEIISTEFSESVKIRIEFSQEAGKIMDSVLGEGATRSFFHDVYEVNPDFCPDVECFEDFFDSLVPVVERLYSHKMKLEKMASMERMAKYQPRDYKRPAGK